MENQKLYNDRRTAENTGVNIPNGSKNSCNFIALTGYLYTRHDRTDNNTDNQTGYRNNQSIAESEQYVFIAALHDKLIVKCFPHYPHGKIPLLLSCLFCALSGNFCIDSFDR